MKIGVFFPPINHFGGFTVVTLEIVNTLAKNGYDVKLFINKPLDQQYIEEFMGEKLYNSVEIVHRNSYFRRNDKSILDLYVSAIQSMSFKSKCDILIDTYSNCVFPWTNICYIHFPFSSDFQSSFSWIRALRVNAALKLPYVFFERKLQRYEGKLLLANSSFTANVIKRLLGVEAQVLYPPVRSAFFGTSLMQNERPRKDLVVTCSRISRGKGLEVIPDIANLTDKRIRFVIVGAYHDEKTKYLLLQKIERLNLSRRVRLLTDVSRSHLIQILRNAKVYLHTTIMEHFGISIAEAMATGCVPIVHNSGGAKEFVPSKFRYKNYSEAAQKIENVIYNWSPKDAKEMSKIAQRFCSSSFSKKFLELFYKYIESIKRSFLKEKYGSALKPQSSKR